MSDNELNSGHFIRWKTLKQATNDALKTIALHGQSLVDELNHLENVPYDIDGQVKMIGCVDAAMMAISFDGTIVQRLMIMQTVGQSLLNAISKYDDIHDWRDVGFDPNERGANHSKAVAVDVLEKELNSLSLKIGIKKKTGSIDALKDAVFASFA